MSLCFLLIYNDNLLHQVLGVIDKITAVNKSVKQIIVGDTSRKKSTTN
jgi:hypothetical protein